MNPIKFSNPNKLPWVLVEKVSTAIVELAEFGEQFEHGDKSEFLNVNLQNLVDRKKNHQEVWQELATLDAWLKIPENKITQEFANMYFHQLMLFALSLYVEALYAESIEEFVTYFGSGMQAAGYAMGIAWNEDESLVRSNLAKKASKASKSDTELQKANILRWYSENKGLFKSVDKASLQAAKIEPVVPRTAAKWIRESLKSEEKNT